MGNLPPVVGYEINNAPAIRQRGPSILSAVWRLFTLVMWAFSPVIAWFTFLIFWFGVWPWFLEQLPNMSRAFGLAS